MNATVAERRAELHRRIKRCDRNQAEYETTSMYCQRALESLDPEDPETRDAARELLRQMIHADNCAAEASRYAMYARNELADLNEKARAA
jgi:hypothetical protein